MIALALLFRSAQNEAVDLAHLFRKGEKTSFQVQSRLRSEFRPRGTDTWFPDSTDYRYRFDVEVQDVLPQGVAKIRYRRPSITKTFSEQFDRPERTETERVEDDILLQISSANEILDAADVKKPKPTTAVKDDWHGPLGVISQATPERFLKTFYGLALFTGSLESSIDFNPRLPFDKVKKGETWKRTATYAPQKLKGSASLAVQRLDYAYTYGGVVESRGRLVDRVSASLHLESDVAAYLHQTYGLEASQTHLRSLPVTLDATMEFDLDRKTHQTLRAEAHSRGEIRVFTSESGADPSYEERIDGETSMEPLSALKAPMAKE